MSETYDAVYAAARSRIMACDTGDAIHRAVRDLGLENIRHDVQCMLQEISAAQTAPHILMKPSLAIDGNMYSALYGENIQEGCAGFGKTPAEAMADFDRNWHRDRTPTLFSNKRPSGGSDD